jgi:hypothetical protein
MRTWRNWQTRRLEGPVPVRVCGFESHRAHKEAELLGKSATRGHETGHTGGRCGRHAAQSAPQGLRFDSCLRVSQIA